MMDSSLLGRKYNFNLKFDRLAANTCQKERGPEISPDLNPLSLKTDLGKPFFQWPPRWLMPKSQCVL